MHKSLLLLALGAVITTALTPAQSFACACGCGIFDVGTSAMLPTQEGGRVFLEYDYLNQDRNWKASSSAPSANNDDKDIKTHFITVGAQYAFDRSWSAQVSVPYWQRHFTTTDDTTGDTVSFDHGSIGDIRLKGIYTGLSGDMSTGLTFGTKLPTGSHSQRGFDRDTAIGTGSTDLLLGAYHLGSITSEFGWFANTEFDQPVLTQNHYRPGREINAAAGIYYHGWRVGGVQVAPIMQAINGYKWHDNGTASNRQGSGYERVLLSPGLEVDVAAYRVYTDVAFPVYDNVHNNQLTAPVMFKLNVSRSF